MTLTPHEKSFQDSSSLFQKWKLVNTKQLNQGMMGMDDGFKILDFGPDGKFSNEKGETIDFILENNIIVLLNRKGQPWKDASESQQAPIIKIQKLSMDSLILVVSGKLGKENDRSIVDLFELHYEVFTK